MVFCCVSDLVGEISTLVIFFSIYNVCLVIVKYDMNEILLVTIPPCYSHFLFGYILLIITQITNVYTNCE